jgi:hypothetical protein
LADVVARVFSLLLSMMPDELSSSNSAKDAFSNVPTVVRALVTSPSVLLLANENNVVVAVGIAVSVTVAAIQALLITGLLGLTINVYLFNFALIVIVFLLPFLPTGFTTRNGSLFGNLRTVNNLILRLFTTHDDLLAHGLLENNGLRGILTDNNRLRVNDCRSGWGWGRRFWAEVLGGSGVLFQCKGGFSYRLQIILPFVLP